MPPGRLGVGAVAGAVRRGPGEGLQVGPVHGQRRAGVLEFFRDAGFEQAVAGALQFRRRQPVRLVLAERPGGQAEGVLGLPVGELVRAVLPVRQHAEPPLLVFGQAGQRLAHPGQVRGTAVGRGEHHAQQQGADAQLPHPRAGGQQRLDPRRDAGGVDDAFQYRQRDHGRAAPSSRTASASPAGARPATRLPSRWEQLIPAASMNVARPSSSPAVGQPGRPQPGGVQPRQAAPAVEGGRPGGSSGSGGRDRHRRRSGRPRRSRRRPAAGRGSRPARNRAGPGTAHGDDHAAGPARDVAAAHAAQVPADQPGASPQADQPGRPRPPLRRGLRVRQREEAADLRRL